MTDNYLFQILEILHDSKPNETRFKQHRVKSGEFLKCRGFTIINEMGIA